MSKSIQDSVEPALSAGTGAASGDDVAARKRAEELRGLLAAIVASTDDAVISLTLDGVINFWNAGAERLYGYLAAEAIGRSVTLIVPPDRHEEHRSTMERLRLGDRVRNFETVRVTSGGAAIDISLTVSPVYDGDGRVVGASKVARDISSRKRAEAAAGAARKALEEADRRKDRFLAMLAHELRNPLAPLRNSLEMFKRAPRDAAVIEAAKSIMDRQLSHVEQLVEELLDVARINEDRLPLHKHEVDLVSVLQHVVDGFRPLAEASHHQFSATVPSEPIYLDADEVRIAQVFNNLLSNAFKYTLPGGKIDVVAELQGSCVSVSVRDSGVGIPADMLERIFEMFTQVERADDHAQNGFGIGLSLARRLVQMHGGTVKAFSEGPDRGSEFVVTLPLAAPLSDSQAPSRPAVDSRAVVRRRVLIVDDNLDAAESLAILMKLAGHEVRMAFDGLEAVRAAETFRPHIVFLDLGLPKLGGGEAARQIRQHSWGKGMILVAVTGWGQDGDRRKSRESGFDEHLVKPAKLEDLTKIIDRIPVQSLRRSS
jgi:two-component system, chemotaxis family, CheB/CheR fusion protein